MIDTIATMTERNYALVPIPIDRVGQLGHTAHEFLEMQETLFPPANQTAMEQIIRSFQNKRICLHI